MPGSDKYCQEKTQVLRQHLVVGLYTTYGLNLLTNVKVPSEKSYIQQLPSNHDYAGLTTKFTCQNDQRIGVLLFELLLHHSLATRDSLPPDLFAFTFAFELFREAERI